MPVLTIDTDQMVQTAFDALTRVVRAPGQVFSYVFDRPTHPLDAYAAAVKACLRDVKVAQIASPPHGARNLADLLCLQYADSSLAELVNLITSGSPNMHYMGEETALPFITSTAMVPGLGRFNSVDPKLGDCSSAVVVDPNKVGEALTLTLIPQASLKGSAIANKMETPNRSDNLEGFLESLDFVPFGDLPPTVRISILTRTARRFLKGYGDPRACMIHRSTLTSKWFATPLSDRNTTWDGFALGTSPIGAVDAMTMLVANKSFTQLQGVYLHHDFSAIKRASMSTDITMRSLVSLGLAVNPASKALMTYLGDVRNASVDGVTRLLRGLPNSDSLALLLAFSHG